MSVKVGEVLETVHRSIEIEDMVAYGGATWDWHPIHYAPAKAGSPDLQPVVDGQMLGALVAKQVIDRFGPKAFITKMDLRFKAMLFAGDAITVVGKVVDVEGGSVGVDHEVRSGEKLVAEAATKLKVNDD